MFFYPQTPLEICLLSNNIMDYHIVAQGKTTIPSVDDGEEGELTDVRVCRQHGHSTKQLINRFCPIRFVFTRFLQPNLAQKDTPRFACYDEY